MGTLKERSVSARGIVVNFLIVLLIIQLIFGAVASVFADSQGTVNSPIGLYIRSGAGTDNPIVGVLPYYGKVTVIEDATAPDGIKWYKIASDYGNGYVCAEYVTLEPGSSDPSEGGSDIPYSPDEDFEAYLDAQGFPESYRPYLRALHASYPNWRFIAMQTGLDWEEVIYKETHPVSVSLVPNSWSDSWKSIEPAAYNPETDQFTIFDSGGYVAANGYAVAYYMDPRNNMAADTIFQFLSNKFDEETQTLAGIEAIAKDSYLELRNPGDEYDNYIQLIYDVGKNTGVNPMTITSMLIMEQGYGGNSDLISGTCEGYEGYYNFFNIGAYAASGRGAVENGLIYAKNKGWDSPTKAITGGAEIYANNYVYNNKSSIYFQKFNVLNGLSRVGTGQYMTAIYAASSEGRIMAAGYDDLIDGGISFEIPVYENMPKEPSPLPTTIEVPAKPKPSGESGSEKEEESQEESQEQEKPSEDPSEKPEEKPEEQPEENPEEKPEEQPEEQPEEKPAPVEPTVSSDVYGIGDYITGPSSELSCESFLTNLSIANGSATIFDAKGNEIAYDSLASTIIGSGFTIKIYDSEGTEKISKRVMVKGDNNSDGKVNSADALRTQRHSVGSLTLSGVLLAASDINGDGKYNSADALLMQRYSVGTYEIKW